MRILPRPDRVDVDAHVIETERTRDFLGPDEAAFRPRLAGVDGHPGRAQWMLHGQVLGFRSRDLDPQALDARARRAGRRMFTPSGARTLEDVPARLADMDSLGVAVQVLHSTLWIAPLAVPARAEAALCRAWNCWVAAGCARSGGRLRWCCVLPTQGRDAALEALEFGAANGAVAIGLRPYEAGRALADPWHDPLYARASELGLAVAVHIGNGMPTLHERCAYRAATASTRRLPLAGGGRVPGVAAQRSARPVPDAALASSRLPRSGCHGWSTNTAAAPASAASRTRSPRRGCTWRCKAATT